MKDRKIRNLPQFSHCTDQEVDWLLKSSKEVDYEAGQKILDRNTLPEHFYFLIEGKWTMKRYVQGLDRPAVWKTSRPGSWHGGIRTIDLIAPAEVVANQNCRIFEIPREIMHELITKNYIVAQKMLTGIRGGAELLDNHAQEKN